MRRYLLWGTLVVACGALTWQLSRSGAALNWRLFDFVEYWTAGRLTLRGENPYDTALVRETQLEADPQAAGVEMWNPPWTLAVVLPFGAMPPRLAHVLWLVLNMLAMVWSADALWRFYGGSSEKRWVSWAVAFTFLPTFFALTAGQISPLLLLGAVLFLRCERAGRDELAGAAAALLAIKPHLSYLFWIALLLWVVETGRWRVIAGGVVAGAVATLLPMLFNPEVLSQYWHTLSSEPPARYDSPTLGMVLRRLFGRERFGLQFLALVPGLIWFVVYWLRRRRQWNWGEQLPMVIMVSMLTAAYGAWPFDLVLLLVPVIQLAARLRRPFEQPGCFKQPGCRAEWTTTDRRAAIAAVVVYVATNAIAGAQIAGGVEFFWFLWMTPAILFGYAVTNHMLDSR